MNANLRTQNSEELKASNRTIQCVVLLQSAHILTENVSNMTINLYGDRPYTEEKLQVFFDLMEKCYTFIYSEIIEMSIRDKMMDKNPTEF